MRGSLFVFKLQLIKSKVIISVLFHTVILSPIVDIFFTGLWIFEYLTYGSVFFLTLLLTMAITNAAHESAHVTKLHQLGYTTEDFIAYRIGNVSFRIPNARNMTPEENFLVASTPFLSVKQFLAEIISFCLLVIINGVSPFPLNILLAIFTGLMFLSLFASFCALIVIKKKKCSGFCVTLSRNITSRDNGKFPFFNKREY